MPGRCFVGRGDAKQQRLAERTCDEIDADWHRYSYRAHETRTLTVGDAIPDVLREASRYRDDRKSLLTDERPTDREAPV